jgi:hypothetical protein
MDCNTLLSASSRYKSKILNTTSSLCCRCLVKVPCYNYMLLMRSLASKTSSPWLVTSSALLCPREIELFNKASNGYKRMVELVESYNNSYIKVKCVYQMDAIFLKYTAIKQPFSAGYNKSFGLITWWFQV